MVTQNRLHELFLYDKSTGEFTRLIDKQQYKKDTIAGSVNSKGYINISVDGTSYVAHRLAWLYEFGEFPNGNLDHINHDRSDNRIDNLRIATISENNKNISKSSRNTSGFVGVTWFKKTNKWKAQIQVNKKNMHLGYYDDYDDAVLARTNANKKYKFHENHGK